MSDYVVGDLQGCLTPLQHLLAHVDFSPSRDTLWLVGDLVSRGPQSLETLRFLLSLGDSAKPVLGNHDLHLLACAYTNRRARTSEQLQALLQAADREPLLHWLRGQPLIRHCPQQNMTLVHAGLPPCWSTQQALLYAAEVEQALQDDHTRGLFLQQMYGNQPDCWHESLSGWDRLRVITNYLTRMRMLTTEHRLDLTFNAKLDTASLKLTPWFCMAPHQPRPSPILFGHWAALQGQATGAVLAVQALDTGFVWGGSLTLLDLHSNQRYQCDTQLQVHSP